MPSAHGERHDVRLSLVSPHAEKNESVLLKAVRDHYRCPNEFLGFRASGQLSVDPGYFQFGPETICYGRCASEAQQSQPGSALRDVLPHVSTRKTPVVLPFDPSEVIDNLRLERYPCSQMGKSEKAFKSVYYQLRPLTNRALRIGVQRLRAANWDKRQFPHWPVDATVENICERLLLLALKASGSHRIPFIWFWPDGARGCVSMSHDVETRAGRDFTMQLVEIDESFGVKASFQIVPQERYEVTPEYLGEIRSHGFEICVQDLNHDGRLFDDRGEFERRVAVINRYGREFGATGFRSAVLYRNLDWYQGLDFSYDMTVPNVAPLDPQRGGCCTVMPYFIGNVLELPLTTIQDYTLFHVLSERSIELWKIQLEKVLSKNGLASFLVHPDYVIQSEPRGVYLELLTYLSEKRKSEHLWFALPGEVDRWWRMRDQMSLVKADKSWRIVGEGAERAVLAFAKIEDNRIAYEFEGTPHTGRQSTKVKSIS
jgi:hypothetical protein